MDLSNRLKAILLRLLVQASYLKQYIQMHKKLTIGIVFGTVFYSIYIYVLFFGSLPFFSKKLDSQNSRTVNLSNEFHNVVIKQRADSIQGSVTDIQSDGIVVKVDINTIRESIKAFTGNTAPPAIGLTEIKLLVDKQTAFKRSQSTASDKITKDSIKIGSAIQFTGTIQRIDPIIYKVTAITVL